MKGIFELTAAPDLLRKLRYDFERLTQEPTNTYVAFNLFVTAEHLLDWLYPGKANKSKREQIRNGCVLLRICSHIASGAKHFEVEAKHHQSVSDTGPSGGMFSGDMFAGRVFAGRVFSKGGLFVRLQSDAEQAFGHSISALELAAKVLDFWDNNSDLRAAVNSV